MTIIIAFGPQSHMLMPPPSLTVSLNKDTIRLGGEEVLLSPLGLRILYLYEVIGKKH
jgi:hypothetical protein